MLFEEVGESFVRQFLNCGGAVFGELFQNGISFRVELNDFAGFRHFAPKTQHNV